jgi:4-hydroxy-3-polyprenylbenzoate decarboxylase
MNLEYSDLRTWLAGVDKLGELKRLHGAHWDREIGTISSLYERHRGSAALLFDEIPGVDPRSTVLTNTLMSNPRIAYTLGAEISSSGVDLVRHWRSLMRDVGTMPVTTVTDGPVNEHVVDGSAVDLLQFPAPKWHEHDGGRYIGTGCVVIMRDESSDWVNLGTYRVMLHDERHVGLYISPGKHGRLIRERYWDKGERCPVAVSLGQDPLLTALGGIEVPHGTSEYEVAGWLRDEPTPVVQSDVTGLPVPATGEIVIEGFLYPEDERDEGPFGEWTGYYAGGRKPAPVIKVERVRHRSDPILLGVLTGRPPTDDTYYRGILRSAMIWEQLEAAGVPGVGGVWVHEASGGRLWVTVSITQMYAGHARQAGMVASQCHAGAYANRFVVVVDDDIDATNGDDVIWALCTRCDVSDGITTLNNAWSTPLDPMAYPRDKPSFNSRLVIDACKPWHRRETFPATVGPSPDYRDEIIDKWRGELPELGR